MQSKRFEFLLSETWKPEAIGDEIIGEIFVLDQKKINTDMVPYLELIDSNGVPTQVLLGTFALSQLWTNPIVAVGGAVRIRYEGESKTIKKASNYAKIFSCIYFEPGNWKWSVDGSEIEGTTTSILQNKRPTTSKQANETKPEIKSWRDHPVDNSPDPFDPEKELER